MRRLLAPTLAAAMTLAAAPAVAQSSAPQPALATAAGSAPALCQAAIGPKVRPALIALQTAVVAKDSASIPARVAAAEALATTSDERCFIAQMQLRAAVDAKDLAAASAAIDAQRATGAVPTETIANLFEDLGNMQFAAADYSAASTTLERVLQLAPQRGSAEVMLAETRMKQDRLADALPLYQKAVAMELAAGRKPAESWYRHALGAAIKAKSPLVGQWSRDLVSAYPTPANWHDAVLVYAQATGAGPANLIDLYRLQRLNHSVTGEANHANFAQALLDKGFPGEAKSMLDESFAANAVDRNLPSIKALYARASLKAAGDRAALDGQAKAALANTAAKPALGLGEAYYGYGDYAKAATMFRAALSKPGVDANLANLRLGMALAASGDMAGARTALAAVSGPGTEIARYWATYAGARP